MVKTLKKCLAVAVSIGLANAWAAWDDAPLVNTAQASTSSLSLNFGQLGVHQQIGLFMINSNDNTGFHVNFTFANKGYFKAGVRQFALKNIVLSRLSGTLGTNLDEANNTPLTVDAGTGVATWNPVGLGGAPVSATENYLVAIYADWDDQSSGLAGFYQESISATMISGP
jgi:hypothetical protein